MSGLLLAVVAAFAWTGSRQLERALVVAAGARMVSVSQQLATLLDASATRVRTEVRSIANDSTVARALVRPDSAARAAARTALEGWRARTPQLATVELLDARRRQALIVGAPVPSADAAARSRPAGSDSTGRSMAIGSLVATGDTVLFRVTAPVVGARGDTLGFIVEHRQMGAGGQGTQLLGELIGPDAVFLLGDTVTHVWTDLARRASGPSFPLSIGAPVRYARARGGARLGAATRVPRTPWVVWVELSRSSVLAPARTFLLRAGAIAIVLVALGTLAAWLIIHRLTAPLAEMTLAAEGIAAGDYSRRVSATRSDELGRLSAAFNTMVQRVEGSTHELESRVDARTRELRHALEELKSAQDELVRRERLAILGQLAGGVGHELRNPLGVMTNALYYLSLVLRDAAPDVKEYLGIIRTEIGLSEKIVGDLLDYARVKTPRREPVALREVATEQLARLGPPSEVKVELDFPSDLPPAHADRTQIGQVVLNLITNAVQSMDGAGGVSEATGTLTLRGRCTEGTVRLDVADSGAGIAPQHIDRIFEPLYSTKARGIGLGLAVTMALVRANGGEITVTSAPGKGSTFSLALPRMPRAEDVP